jgi:hypothetical protein
MLIFSDITIPIVAILPFIIYIVDYKIHSKKINDELKYGVKSMTHIDVDIRFFYIFSYCMLYNVSYTVFRLYNIYKS